MRTAPYVGVPLLAAHFLLQPESEAVETVGWASLTVWWFGSIALAFLTMPVRCRQGHTDVTWWYGEWRCRTCYRLRHPRDRRTQKQKDEDLAYIAKQVQAELEEERRQKEALRSQRDR